MSSAGRGDARPSNKAGGGGRGGGGGGPGSHSSKKESILELAKASSAPFVVSVARLAPLIVTMYSNTSHRRCHR